MLIIGKYLKFNCPRNFSIYYNRLNSYITYGSNELLATATSFLIGNNITSELKTAVFLKVKEMSKRRLRKNTLKI